MEHNKFETCQDCPDRTVYNTDADADEQQNCHTTCEGYLFRQKQNEEKRKKRRQENTFIEYKRKVVGETIEKVTRKKG